MHIAHYNKIGGIHINIVKIMGGLGNQMFQYAFYKSMKNFDVNTKYDLSLFEKIQMHNGFELDKIFEIENSIANSKDLRLFYRGNNKYINKILYAIQFNKYQEYIQRDYSYLPEVYNLRNTMFIGYWQSEKYFHTVKEELLKDFRFKNTLDAKNKDLRSYIDETESVSLHIRRGDYYSDKNARELNGDICTKDYYLKAVNEINNRIKNPTFFIFSDDFYWVKSTLDFDSYIFVDWNKSDQSYIDMQLMSNCKHNIIANSSFSWWGAYLNANIDKYVISPNKWFNHVEYNIDDIILPDWIQISLE